MRIFIFVVLLLLVIVTCYPGKESSSSVQVFKKEPVNTEAQKKFPPTIAIVEPSPSVTEEPNIVSQEYDPMFIKGEVDFTINRLKETQLVFCESAATESSCYSSREADQSSSRCLTTLKKCAGTFYLANEDELLEFFTPEQIVDRLIGREKDENYIKDPLLNGANLYDESFFNAKLEYLKKRDPLNTNDF